jgi:hypothetical protein
MLPATDNRTGLLSFVKALREDDILVVWTNKKQIDNSYEAITSNIINNNFS